ncbi:MAG: Gfo/Idh/MocA family oxidoreductase, partial [Planctomycetia bacterium]
MPSSARVSRRGLLRRGLAAGTAIAGAPMFIPSSALGLDGAVPPSERIVVGGIGIGRRGEYDLGCFLSQPDVRFAAVCDVKENRRAAVKKIADAHHGDERCATHRDFRELLDRKDIDAVLIATGPNWHGTAAMHAARAG